MALASTLSDQLFNALRAHAAWKLRLAQAIETGTSEFSVDAVRVDNACPFGQWLYGSIDAAARGSAYYEQVRGLHAAFHRQAANVLALALAGRTAEARQAMEVGREFNRASAQLTLALTAWQESVAASST